MCSSDLTFVSQQERRDNQGLISMENYKFGGVKLELGVSGYMDILISNMYSARPLSLNGKEGTTRDSFQWEISAGNESYISMGNYKLN